jgi:uncharacterized protein
MKINIKKIQNGTYNYSETQEFKAVEINDYKGSYTVWIELTKTDEQIHIKNKVETKYLAACDRCLEEFENETESEFELIFIFGTNKQKLEDDNTKFIDQETEYIDITQDIRDYVILSFPMQHICKEDCKGLCPRCGKDKNKEKCTCEEEVYNPLWDKLKDIKLS